MKWSGPPPPPPLPLEAVPDARERKKTGGKGIQIRGGRGTRGIYGKRVSKSGKIGKRDIQNRYDQSSIAMRSYLERVGNLRQHVH